MRTKITKRMLKQLTKIVPTNCPKSILEGLWRPLGSHPWNKVLPRLHFWWFWLHFGTPFGTTLGSLWASFFWCFFEVPFWRLWPPFGLPKHLQNETQEGVKIKTWKSLILLLFTRLLLHSGVLKMVIFQYFFGAFFWDGFWSPFWWFCLTLGVSFGLHVGHF